jgi:hypothetical protein
MMKMLNKWLFCRQLPTLEGTCYLHQILKMEAVGSCTVLVLISNSTWHHVPEDIDLYILLLQEREECPFTAG